MKKSLSVTLGGQSLRLSLAVLMLLTGAGQAGFARAQAPLKASPTLQGPFVGEPVTPTLSIPVRDLPITQAPSHTGEAAPRRNPRPDLTGFGGTTSPTLDPVRQTRTTGRTPAPDFTVEGIGNLFGGSPPDTIGAVGATQYVQLVNATQMSVYDKSGTLLLGPVELNALWASGSCSTSNSGDPVAVYDTLAARWVLAQFSTGNGICVAVSQTSDALGAYYGYQFNTPEFPDYFKIGVWPDAYYVGSNEVTYAAYALDRNAMLAGLAATFVRFSGETNFLLPASVDGSTPPPVGAPGYFYTFKDNSFHGGADRLEIFEFNVDWVTPASSTFGLANTLNTASYTYTVCAFFVFDCIPQAGTAQEVDAVSEWPMWRLQYRNFGDHETMVGNFTVDVTGSDLAGIRWFELRKTTGPWTIYQESTFSPDSTHRFMGSIAMDGDGNIALGYSVSSPTLNPGMRYATRLATDPLNTLQTEVTLFAGGGSQTGSNRWGDYSAMSVDPVDDCTFWYTNEYYPTNSATGWHTRIGTFKIPECGAMPPVADAGADQDVEVGASVTLDGSGSTDPGGNVLLTFGWTQTGGSAVTLSDATAITPTFTAASAPGVLTFTLIVTNSLGLASPPDEVIVTVHDVSISDLAAANDSPTLIGQVTTLSATISAGTNVTYAWDFGDGNVGAGATAMYTYTTAGVYTATVTAMNGAGSVSAATLVTITPYHLFLTLILK